MTPDSGIARTFLRVCYGLSLYPTGVNQYEDSGRSHPRPRQGILD